MCETSPPIRLKPAPALALWTIAVALLRRWACDARRPAIRRCAGSLVVALLGTITARANEVCQFAGTTDYSGQIEVTTDVSARGADGTNTVDVIVHFTATPWPFVHIRYLMQEVSTWKSDRLQSVAANSRYLRGWTPIVRPDIGSVRARASTGLEACTGCQW